MQMNRVARCEIFIAFAALFLIFSFFMAPLALAKNATVVELAGSTRFETNRQIVSASYESGADTVILASATSFPDALSGSTLVGALDAPLVLVNKDSVDADTLSFIDSLHAKNVIVLGGDGVISDGVVSAIQQHVSGSAAPVRLGGSNRYETNYLIYNYMVKELGMTFTDEVIVTTGEGFADALSISPYAAWANSPIILSSPTGISSYMTSVASSFTGQVTVCGGSNAVSASTLTTFANRSSLKRLAGETRYETSKLIADYAISCGMESSSICIATGQNFPDALSGCQLGFKKGCPLVLANGSSEGLNESEPLYSYIRANDTAINTVYYLGGTGAFNQSKRDAVAKLLADAEETCTVTWTGFDTLDLEQGKVIYNDTITQTYKKGDALVEPSFTVHLTGYNPTRYGDYDTFDVPQKQSGSCAFAGWDKELPTTVTTDMTFTATWIEGITTVSVNGGGSGTQWPGGDEATSYVNNGVTNPFDPSKGWEARLLGNAIRINANVNTLDNMFSAWVAHWSNQAIVWRDIRVDTGYSQGTGYRIAYYMIYNN